MKNAVLLAACIVTALAFFGCGKSNPTAPVSNTGFGSIYFSISGARSETIQIDGRGGNPTSWSAPGIWPYTLLPRTGVTARTYTFQLRRWDADLDSAVPSGVGVHAMVMICQNRNSDGTFDQFDLLLSRYDTLSAGKIPLFSKNERYASGEFQWPTPFAGRMLRAKARFFYHVTSIDSTTRNLPNCFTSIDDDSTIVEIHDTEYSDDIDLITPFIVADLVNPQGEHLTFKVSWCVVNALRDDVGLY